LKQPKQTKFYFFFLNILILFTVNGGSPKAPSDWGGWGGLDTFLVLHAAFFGKWLPYVLWPWRLGTFIPKGIHQYISAQLL